MHDYFRVVLLSYFRHKDVLLSILSVNGKLWELRGTSPNWCIWSADGNGMFHKQRERTTTEGASTGGREWSDRKQHAELRKCVQTEQSRSGSNDGRNCEERGGRNRRNSLFCVGAVVVREVLACFMACTARVWPKGRGKLGFRGANRRKAEQMR